MHYLASTNFYHLIHGMLTAPLREVDARAVYVQSVYSHMWIVNNVTLLCLVWIMYYEVDALFKHEILS